MRIKLGLALVVAGWVVLGELAASQNRAQVQQLELVAPGSTLTATLVLPPTPGRVPVAVIPAGSASTDRSSLADALAAAGVASLQPGIRPADRSGAGAPASAATTREIAAWITRLRNDVRFSRVMVIGQGEASLAGMHAARAARADGFVSLGAAPAASYRSTIPVFVADAADVERIVRFIRSSAVPRHPETERRSPRDIVMTEIAGCRMAIEYGRPSKRGRVIWGVLVPWERWWMPGADEATSFTTSEPIVVEGLVVPAGDYTLYTLPGETSTKLIISIETGQFHTVYNPDRDLGRVEMKLTRLDVPVEQMTFAIEPQGAGGAIRLVWDDRAYSAPFVVRGPIGRTDRVSVRRDADQNPVRATKSD